MNKIDVLENSMKKAKIADVRVGDSVRVHQKIHEGNKSRIQVFEGLVIRYRKVNSLAAYITVRKITSGVGVEKSWFVHSPNVEKIEVMKRSKVRRAFLTYMRARQGKSARMTEADFDKTAANQADGRTAQDIAAEEQAKIVEAEAKEGDKAAKDDVLNQSDTEEIDTEVKKEDKAAAKEDASASQDDVPASAPKEEKQALEDDEAQAPADEVQEGLDKAAKKSK